MIQPRHIVIAAITACALLPAGSCHGAAFAGKYTRMITQVQGMEARKILGMADSCARLGLADSPSCCTWRRLNAQPTTPEGTEWSKAHTQG